MHHHEKRITGGYQCFASFCFSLQQGHVKEMFSIVCPGQLTLRECGDFCYSLTSVLIYGFMVISLFWLQRGHFRSQNTLLHVFWLQKYQLLRVLAPKDAPKPMCWFQKGHQKMIWLPVRHFCTCFGTQEDTSAYFGSQTGSLAHYLAPKNVCFNSQEAALVLFWLLKVLCTPYFVSKEHLFSIPKGHWCMVWLPARHFCICLAAFSAYFLVSKRIHKCILAFKWAV